MKTFYSLLAVSLAVVLLSGSVSASNTDYCNASSGSCATLTLSFTPESSDQCNEQHCTCPPGYECIFDGEECYCVQEENEQAPASPVGLVALGGSLVLCAAVMIRKR